MTPEDTAMVVTAGWGGRDSNRLQGPAHRLGSGRASGFSPFSRSNGSNLATVSLITTWSPSQSFWTASPWPEMNHTSQHLFWKWNANYSLFKGYKILHMTSSDPMGKLQWSIYPLKLSVQYCQFLWNFAFQIKNCIWYTFLSLLRIKMFFLFPNWANNFTCLSLSLLIWKWCLANLSLQNLLIQFIVVSQLLIYNKAVY